VETLNAAATTPLDMEHVHEAGIMTPVGEIVQFVLEGLNPLPTTPIDCPGLATFGTSVIVALGEPKVKGVPAK